MIAVMGAAGHVGSKVTDLLLQRDQQVRVLGRSRERLEAFRARGAEVVTGDARNVDDLNALFKGVDAAFVMLPEDLRDPQFVATRANISRAIARALRDQAVRHVVALSSVGADRGNGLGPANGLHDFEQRLAELKNLNVMVLRATFYMENLLANLPLIRAQKINGSAIKGDLAFPMIATQDVAREAAERLLRRDVAGHGVKMLLGPEDVSMREATRALGAALRLPELPYVEFPPAELKGGLVGAGFSDEAAWLMVELQDAINTGRMFEHAKRTAEATTPTRLQDFLRSAVATG